MHSNLPDTETLTKEHRTLLRHYGKTQARCSDLIRMQSIEIALLQAEAIRLRAAVIVRDTALAWAAEARATLETDDLAGLEGSLFAADLVICQTGCLSHGAYWRVQDHCNRTGKTSVLVEQPDALRIVRILPSESTTRVD